MGRLSQTIDYINAEKVTEEDKDHKYTDIIIDDHLIKLRRNYRAKLKRENKLNEKDE